MHAGIAGRVFGSIGPSAAPTRTIHDGLTRAIYSSVDRGLRGVTHAVGTVAAEIWGDDGHEALESRIGPAAAIPAVNGIYGDELTERDNPLAGAMAIRQHGQTGSADDRVAGSRISDGHRPGCRVCTRLVSYRAVMVSEATRGRGQPQLWRTVGHSMGGLVARSACHYGAQLQHRWTDAVSHVVCLGSPHLGADLEKGVSIASWALARLPETRAIAAFSNFRSDGVKDLRFGACLDEDWCDADPDEFLRDRCHDAPFLPRATYHFVAATVTPPLLGIIAGDHLVRSQSAAGRGRSRHIPFDVERGLTLTGLNHLDLLNHPLVYAKLHDWLAQSPASSAGRL